VGCRAGVGFRALEEGERRGGGETRRGRERREFHHTYYISIFSKFIFQSFIPHLFFWFLAMSVKGLLYMPLPREFINFSR